jgi:hypothetical protein
LGYDVKNIKIFISYHDEHYKIKSKILKPIQTGCSNAVKLFSGMLRDDIGENISEKNNKYCELSAQYWVWKNYDKIQNPDYVGFMHYRRHFMFDNWTGNPDWCWLPKGNVYFVPNITPQYLTHISDEKIQKCLDDCDCIVLKPYDVKFLESENIRHQYSRLPEQDSKIFDEFIKVAKELHPDYMSEIEMIEHGSIQYLCNMFIMTKDLFFEYNKFCFSILEELDKRIDSSRMSESASRFLGYIGEFCLSIFVFHLKKTSKTKIKELNGAYILSDEAIVNPRRKYWYYWFISKITFGKIKKKYKQKRRQMKDFMVVARKL